MIFSCQSFPATCWIGEKICLLVKWSAKTLIISADIDNSMEPIGYPSKENDLFFDRMREHNFQIGVDGVTPFEKAIWKEIDFFAPNDADWKKSVQWILQQVNNNIQQKYSHSGISFTISTPPSSGIPAFISSVRIVSIADTPIRKIKVAFNFTRAS